MTGGGRLCWLWLWEALLFVALGPTATTEPPVATGSWPAVAQQALADGGATLLQAECQLPVCREGCCNCAVTTAAAAAAAAAALPRAPTRPLPCVPPASSPHRSSPPPRPPPSPVKRSCCTAALLPGPAPPSSPPMAAPTAPTWPSTSCPCPTSSRWVGGAAGSKGPQSGAAAMPRRAHDADVQPVGAPVLPSLPSSCAPPSGNAVVVPP